MYADTAILQWKILEKYLQVYLAVLKFLRIMQFCICTMNVSRLKYIDYLVSHVHRHKAMDEDAIQIGCALCHPFKMVQ